ncbi:pseudouridine-5'-phosphatase-like protein [Leptotrombidium deliense]|uniref:Pseudouridine-5'-phosphatase-like protein n=1 Tax=Leptotrombidium deliense TaxID=299467 RepID=A0A443SDE2_9ACAR|nr:pseudouridine-5'-phosphatase-like protein [Leptotrombidium deliense]
MSFVKVQKEILKPVTHVVFDLDGTLIDTETCFKDAVNQVTSRYGKEFTWEHVSRLSDTNVAKECNSIVNEFRLPMSAKEFQEEYNDVFSVLIKSVPFMPGAEKIIQYFHSNKIPIGLCTASVTQSYNIKVKQFDDFFTHGKYFDVIVVGDDPDVFRNKPDPQPYLVTISRLPGNPNPENVLVFEDSLFGVTSAIAAGTQCVMIPNYKVDNGKATPKATVVIDSLNDFDPLFFCLPPLQ